MSLVLNVVLNDTVKFNRDSISRFSIQKQSLARPRLSLPPQIQNEVSGGGGGGGGGGLDFPRAEKPLKGKQEGVEREGSLRTTANEKGEE